jgi:hypothetical protein
MYCRQKAEVVEYVKIWQESGRLDRLARKVDRLCDPEFDQ